MMKRLNEILSEIGISKVKLAKYLNVSRQMVYNYLEMEDVNLWPLEKKMKLFNLLDIKEAEDINNIKVDAEFINKVDMVLNGDTSNLSISHAEMIEFKELKPREQELLNDEYIRFYSGQISFDATLPVLSGAALALNSAQGKVFKLASTATTANITIASSNFEDGDIITLVGSGGAGPLTLANSSTTGVLLKNATTWTALDGATITLKVVEADKKYYVEQSRS